MKISNTSARTIPGFSKTGMPASSGQTQGLAAEQNSGTDKLQLSRLSQFLSGSNSPSHTAKLSQLNAAVSSGQYSVEAGVVSASIIQYSLAGSLA